MAGSSFESPKVEVAGILHQRMEGRGRKVWEKTLEREGFGKGGS